MISRWDVDVEVLREDDEVVELFNTWKREKFKLNGYCEFFFFIKNRLDLA